MAASTPNSRLNVVVGLDLTERSEPAFARAVRLAQEHNGELFILHVVSAYLPDAIANAHTEYANTIIQDHASRARGSGLSDVTQVLARGRDYETIVEHAKQTDADLVVLGTHRSRGMVADLLGTTVDRVLRLSGRPILLVQRRTSHSYKRILVAVDFSSASRIALGFVFKLFPEAEVLVVNTWGRRHRPKEIVHTEAPEDSEAHRLALSAFVQEIADKAGPRPDGEARQITKIVETGRPETIIPDLAEERLADLVVVGTHARTGLTHLFLGSVAQEIMLRVSTDVLAVPPPLLSESNDKIVRDTLLVA